MRDIAKRFLETNETSMNTKEIKGTDVFEIDLVCVTPLAQISPNGGQTKRYFYQDDTFLQEPFYTSNGFRGFLRRVAFMDLVEHIKDFENYKPKGEETYLYTSGNGGDKKSILMVTNWEKEQKVRKASPLLSLFGAGLGNIAGKVAIDELVTPNIENKFIEGKKANGEPYKISKFLGRNGETRADSLLNDDIQMIIDSEDAQRVSQSIRAEAETAKKAKKEGVETDAKQQNAQMIFDVEYLIAGTPLKTAINPICNYEFTDVEKGCLLSIMISASQSQTGAYKRKGFGRLNWNVKLNGEQLMSAIRDSECHSYIKIEVSQKGKELLKKYKDFLNENIKSSNDILIENMIA